MKSNKVKVGEIIMDIELSDQLNEDPYDMKSHEDFTIYAEVFNVGGTTFSIRYPLSIRSSILIPSVMREPAGHYRHDEVGVKWRHLNDDELADELVSADHIFGVQK